jgi:hypothetical protein
MLEITDPIEFKLDANGGLEKAVWIDEKGCKITMEWNEKTKTYSINEVKLTPRQLKKFSKR